MKPCILYTHVMGACVGSYPASHYEPYSRRFLRTYLDFMPDMDHTLKVICCKGSPDDATRDMFDGYNTEYAEYHGDGWDIGAWQKVALETDTELFICLNSTAYFWRRGWLNRIVSAWQKYGTGVYGTMASYENSPHLRASGTCFTREVIHRYGHTIASRGDCYRFESLQWNFSQWAINTWYPTMFVTWDGVYEQKDWRKPANIFRRGDQSNLLNWDRHCDWYMGAYENEQKRLAGLADQPSNPIKVE